MTDEYPEPNDSSAPLAEVFAGIVLTALMVYGVYVDDTTLLIVGGFGILFVTTLRVVTRGIE